MCFYRTAFEFGNWEGGEVVAKRAAKEHWGAI